MLHLMSLSSTEGIHAKHAANISSYKSLLKTSCNWLFARLSLSRNHLNKQRDMCIEVGLRIAKQYYWCMNKLQSTHYSVQITLRKMFISHRCQKHNAADKISWLPGCESNLKLSAVRITAMLACAELAIKAPTIHSSKGLFKQTSALA